MHDRSRCGPSIDPRTRLLCSGLLAMTFAAIPPGPRVPASPAASMIIKLASSSVVGGNVLGGTVVIDPVAPAGGMVVTLRTSTVAVAGFLNPKLGPSSAVASTEVVIPAGGNAASFQISTFGVAQASGVDITAASSSTSANTSLTVMPASVQRVILQPAQVTGGITVAGQVTLNGAAPVSKGATVELSTGPSIPGSSTAPGGPLAAVPAKIPVPPGANSASFTVKTTPTDTRQSVVVAATLGGSAQASLTVLPPTLTGLSVNPGNVVSGAQATGTVSLDGPAPPSGFALQITTNSPSVVVPQSMIVPAGAATAPFPIQTRPVTNASAATVTASPPVAGQILGDGSVRTVNPAARSAALTLNPMRVSVLQLTPSSPGGAIAALGSAVAEFGGHRLTGTVQLVAPAPSAGVEVTLQSSNSIAQVPLSLSIPAGQSRATFTVNTASVSQSSGVNISASAKVVGATATGSTTAPSIADGTSNTISVGEGSAGQATALLTLIPLPVLKTVFVSPSPAAGGQPVTLSVNFTGAELVPPTLGAPQAQISVSPPGVLQLPPTVALARNGTVLTLGGTTTASVSGSTLAAAVDQTVTVSVSLEGHSVSTTLQVTAPVPPIASFSLRPATSKGGNNVFGSLTPDPRITAVTSVTLSSDHPGLLTLPASTTIAPGQTRLLTIGTSAVSAPTTVIITATAGTQKMTATLILTS